MFLIGRGMYPSGSTLGRIGFETERKHFNFYSRLPCGICVKYACRQTCSHESTMKKATNPTAKPAWAAVSLPLARIGLTNYAAATITILSMLERKRTIIIIFYPFSVCIWLLNRPESWKIPESTRPFQSPLFSIASPPGSFGMLEPTLHSRVGKTRTHEVRATLLIA